MSEILYDARFKSLVGSGLQVQRLAGGFAFVEGPAWNVSTNSLVFSDIPANRLLQWNRRSGISVLREPSNMANGNTFDRRGRLISCEHASSRLVRAEADGTMTVLASHYGERELNSPNDVVVDSTGRIYFSDPNYGRTHELVGIKREQEIPWQGVYRIASDGDLTVIADDFEQPNGLCLDEQERYLYVNDTLRRHIRRWALDDAGGTSGGEIWAEFKGDGPSVPDGMKIDSAGTLFCTGGEGIQVFDREAHCLGAIVIPEKTANFAWGDDDFKTLYVTASTSLYRVRVAVPGNPLFQSPA